MTETENSLAQQIDDLRSRVSAAEAECAAKDAFIAAISRELNNPLSPVLLAVEHLRAVLAGTDPARLEPAMQRLERATDGFASRTRVLLDLADLAAGVAPLALTGLDVSGLVARTAARSADIARLAGCVLVLESPPGLTAKANAEALHQVLGHVLANAFRFGAGRPVRLAARRGADGGAVITVADEGPGIDPAKADRLFSPFLRARTPLEPGLGIGLWVSAQLVAAMGGAITADSLPGRGAHVHVRLAPPGPVPVVQAAQNLQTGRG